MTFKSYEALKAYMKKYNEVNRKPNVFVFIYYRYR